MIGGNAIGVLQVSTVKRNSIGEPVEDAWHDVVELEGWLDLASGDSKYTTYDAKIQESTHVFVGDYKPIPDTVDVDGKVIKVRAETTRFLVNSQVYDVMLLDDPMGLHKQLEIFLKYTGGR